MKPCEFVKLSYSEDDAKNLPISIQFAQTQISKSSSVTDIEGSVGNGALPYFIEIYGVRSGANISNCPANIKKLYDLFNDYKRPGITRAYLSSLFYVFKLSDYGSQALSPEFTDFTISCYNKVGAKINHTYTALIRELNSRDAYVLIDKTGIAINKGDMLTVRVSYKINNNNKKLLKLKKSDTKYNCFYYDPEETDDFHELSILASADSYCFYKKSGETFHPLLNSFAFSLVKQENKSYIKTAPQTGHMIKNNEALPTTEGGIVIADNIADASKIHISDDGALILDTLYDDIESKMMLPSGIVDNTITTENEETVKMILEPDTVSDYFRQLYNSRKSGSVEKVSTPSMRDRYIIEFYPQVDIGRTEEIYLGTRMLEDDVFFYDSTTFNKTLNDVSCIKDVVDDGGATKKHHSDEISADITNTAYRFNSMDQFEVYKFESKSSPFGKKIPVEYDDLYYYDESTESYGTSKLFTTDYSVSDGVYEIVPRFDNQMFASILYDNCDPQIKYCELLEMAGLYNSHKIDSDGSLYLFVDGCLFYNNENIITTSSIIEKLDSVYAESMVELCAHIPYTIGDDYSYGHYDINNGLGIYGSFTKYCNKNIFRDGAVFNKHDLGLIVSDNIDQDDDIYVYSYNEKVPYRIDSDSQKHEICYIDNDNGTLSINSPAIGSSGFDRFTKLDTVYKEKINEIRNNISFRPNKLYTFEEKYLNILYSNDVSLGNDKNGLELIENNEYISLVNVSYIGIPDNIEFPLYVYGRNKIADFGLVDILYPENIYDGENTFNVLCCRLVKKSVEDVVNFLYIPFYYTGDTIKYICFKNKNGDNITTKLKWNMSSVYLDTYWTLLDED